MNQQNPPPKEVPKPERQRVLLVDDDPTQLKLSSLRLRQAGFSVTPARSAAEALELATAEPPDAVMSDVIMEELDGFGLCRRLKEQSALAFVPVVLLSAHYGDAKARELATRVGASALIGRSPEFDAELQALRHVLGQDRSSGRQPIAVDTYEEHLRTNADQISKLAGDAKAAEQRYRALFENANDTISVLNPHGVILEANERWRFILGAEPATLVGKHLLDFAPRGRETTGKELAAAIARGSGRVHGVALERADTAIVYMDFSITVVELAGLPLVLAIGRDITGRFLAAQALVTAEEKYRSLVERMPDAVWTTSGSQCTFVTKNIERLTGYTPIEICAMTLQFWLQRVHPDDDARVEQAMALPSQDSSRAYDLEYRWRRKDGSWVWLWHRTIAHYERGGVPYTDGLLSDITQRKQLEQSLRQAQKMEALGQLTGGIAHDFNNILATILANAQFLIDAIGANDPRLIDAQEIKLASERAASLTRQLLAFSRKQALEFRVTDLNRVVSGVDRMLRRLIGEDIEMVFVPGADLGHVHVDAGQIEQVLMNLAVNARDAMPLGGKLTIETSNVELDASYSSAHAAGAPGNYVLLSVSDTGSGMDAETQRRIFEPFFTTKELGRGTGLGLATCHGIVAQSGGHIGVYSELGHGTVFKVYLPRVDSQAVASTQAATTSEKPVGRETILLVEDDPPLRAAVQRMLTAHGYRVLAARHGAEATELAARHGSAISLLVTDVVMPIVSGPEVAKAVQMHVPTIKVLFMSGYSDHAMFRSAELQGTVSFIQKPFPAQAFAKKVRETLDG